MKKIQRVALVLLRTLVGWRLLYEGYDKLVLPGPIVPVGMLLVGFSLVAGLFTQAGCIGAMLLLTLFSLSAMPTSKDLIEFAAVLVIFASRTGEIAGLDRFRPKRSPVTRGAQAPTSV